jgi:dihydroorotate dehydrogenase (fumarate)
MSVDLTTRYLGMELKNPLVVSSCSLTGDLNTLRRLEEAGAAAVVLPSLFEEKIVHDEDELIAEQEAGTESFAESLTYFPAMEDYGIGPDRYLHHIEEAKKALSIPVIGSLNGFSRGGWVRYAKSMQDAGADALELNIYFISTDPLISGEQIEGQYLDLVAAVKQSVSIPLAVKIGPYFSSLANMAGRLAEAGADGLVLFNRFVQPDIDPEALEATPKMVLSDPYEELVPLRWIAILHGRISASLAMTGGVHTAEGAIKALLAGADATMLASVLYQRGTKELSTILRGIQNWLVRKDYSSVGQLKGSMSHQNCPDPAAFERGNYAAALWSFEYDTTKDGKAK